MYIWIDGEKWDGDGRPSLAERKNIMLAAGPTSDYQYAAEWYGRILTDEEEKVVVKALAYWRAELPLPLD